MAPEIGPKSFRGFEKRTPGLRTSLENGMFWSEIGP